MGVAEHSHAIRPQRQGRLGRGRDILGRLARKAVHQVEIDGLYADLAQSISGGGHLIKGLDPVDPRLHVPVEGLHPKACTGHPGLACGVDKGVGQHARVQFNGHLGARPQGEAIGHAANEGQEMFRRKGVGAAAAEMQVGGAGVRRQGVCPQIHLAHQGPEKGLDPLVVVNDAGMATAIPAQPPAEGHMDIGGDRLVSRDGGQPLADLRFAFDRRKGDRRRVAGVTRQASRGMRPPGRRQAARQRREARSVVVIVRHAPT